MHQVNQERHDRDAKQHQLNADILTIAKYGIHVVSFTLNLKGIKGSSPKGLSKLGYYVANTGTAVSNYGLAQDAIDLVQAADAAVKAAQSIYSAATAP